MEWTKEKLEEVQYYYEKTTLPIKEIADKTNLTLGQIRSKMARLGIKRPPELKTSTHKEGVNVLLDWTPEFAWWLGWFLSDGCLHGTQLIIYNTEIDVLEKMKALIQSDNKIHTLKHKADGGHIGTKTSYSFSFRSKKLVDRLAALGITKDRDYVPDMPKECIPHFLRGFFEGDGSIKPEKYVVTVGGKKEVIEKVQQLIEEIYPEYRQRVLLQKNNIKNFWILNICTKKEIHDLLNLMYKDAGELYLKYKKPAFVSI